MIVTVGALFSGIGAHHSALKRLNIPGVEFKVIFQADTDLKAVRAYNLLHGDTPNLGDITELTELPAVDLLFFTPPCQDISMQNRARPGNARGSGTRSALVWDVVRLLGNMDYAQRPAYMIMEEVASMINKKNMPVFAEIIDEFNALGYSVNYSVLNSKDYGVPQSRKRCYAVFAKDRSAPALPDAVPLTRTLGDVLDNEVAPCYYLSEERVKGLVRSSDREREREETGLSIAQFPPRASPIR